MQTLPIIDLRLEKKELALAIKQACSEYGFFFIVGHQVNPQLELRLEKLSEQFFAQSVQEKKSISMSLGGRAWRGYFAVGEELTSGKKDLKEGIYFGTEHELSDKRVMAGVPLHGQNLFPDIPDFSQTILTYMEQMTKLGHQLMELISLSLGLDENYFKQHYTEDPTLLFRLFHYPQHNPTLDLEYPWGVGAHTDYGILTILKQDSVGGLEIQTKSGWINVPPIPLSYVCNIGDMLDFLTQGHYRSAPHRVRNVSGKERYSYPFFFDPNFFVPVRPLPLDLSQEPERGTRWDEKNLYDYEGSYGNYLLGKVSKVFPDLAASKLGPK